MSPEKILGKIGPASFSFSFPIKIVTLHSMLISCGHQSVDDPKYSWNGLKRCKEEFVVWQWTLNGAGYLEYEGKGYELTPGTAMLVHIPHRHRYFLPSSSRNWEFLYLCINGSDAVRLCRKIEQKQGPVLQIGNESKSLAVALEIFMSAAAGKIDSPYVSSRLCSSFVMAMLEEQIPYSPSTDGRPDFITKVINYCEENICSDLTVDDLARISGYSRYHFTRIFTKCQGLAPMQFVNELRLKRAVRLMQTENLSIKEIAARCGFENISYFCRYFAKKYGTTPAKYRK